MDNNKMRFIDYLAALGLFLLAMLAASCSKADIPEPDPLCTKGDATLGAVCIEIYAPVIAPDGTEYPNSCYAQRDGWDNSCLIVKEL